ncbi:hypothetical protein CO709_15810 [Burkholderia thailandensis]|nr:hypothetical protein CO709_15810 [Burkholderia thailandensis]
MKCLLVLLILSSSNYNSLADASGRTGASPIAFEHYNEQHPHRALKYRSPREFRRRTESSTQV